nr:PliI family lysozyme inhibitor of I-type lysozyme [Motiliproteus sediminis]
MVLGMLLGAAQSVAGDELTLQYPAAEPLLVVAAEGKGESQSIGSYVLRLYRVDNPDFPRDHYLHGIVRPRDGVLERLEFIGVDPHGALGLMVVMRSVGTGSYLRAEAFEVVSGRLSWRASTDSLPAEADPAGLLRQQLGWSGR